MKYETANALCVRLPARAAVDIARCVPELAGVKQREHDGSGVKICNGTISGTFFFYIRTNYFQIGFVKHYTSNSGLCPR